MINLKEYITINPEILGGHPVFQGTRAPGETLIDHLENGVPLDDFLEDFLTVSREKAVAVIEIAAKIVSSKDIQKLYETAA
jgi:uncharacterized protein (DUF433 family)